MNAQQIFVFLCLINCKTISSNSIGSKIKSFITGKKGDKLLDFRIDESPEYPNGDQQKIAYWKKRWNKYYDCLITKYRDLGPYKSLMPEAHLVFEGTSIRLDSKMCVSPEEAVDTENVVWYYQSIPPNGTTPVELGDHVFVSPEDKFLHMYNVNIETSGQYFCQKGSTVTAPHFLEVVGNKEPIRMVRPETAPYANHSRGAEIITEHKLEVFTKWGQWSPCSTCNEVGKKVRTGICMVKRHEVVKDETTFGNDTAANPNATTVNATENLTKTTERNHTNTYKRQASSTNIYEGLGDILQLFKKGIPCHSVLLPPNIKNLPPIKERESEIMVAFCKVPCPDESVFEVQDDKGNVLETANNSAGIYSILQGIPSVPPNIQRRTIYMDVSSKRAELRCPGNLNSDTPIKWQIGSMNANPQVLYSQTKGRIYVNIKDHLVIKRLRLVDSNIYSCWQGKELAGTIRLEVTKKVQITFNHHIMLTAMVLILGTFLLVFYRAFRGRRNVIEG
ncbi:Ig-like V-type domain-containing protein FAM187A [Anabrus simplex]|uniref:Ig-like V-type domain-containing protein FAM187A n=1 Tax=Anabrus simplex TaxID=316456 RepID=UPI0035A277EC